MRVKEADILDFLSVPQKVSSTVYEVMAKDAADAYIKSRTDPNQTIAKIASSKGLNPDQIHRVVELTNHSINSSLSKESKDQLFTFPVATVKGVMAAMSTEKDTDIEKSAEEPEDLGAYAQFLDLPDYADTVAARKFNKFVSSFSAKKTASDEEKPAVSQDALAKLASEGLKRARGELDYAETNLRAALAAVKSDWSKLAEQDREEYLYGAAYVLGIEDAKSLASFLGDEAQKVAELLDDSVLSKLASYVNEDHEILRRLTVFRDAAKDVVAKREKVAALGSLLRPAASAVLKPVAGAIGKSLEYATKNPFRKLVFAGAAGAAGAAFAKRKLGAPITKTQGAKLAVQAAFTPRFFRTFQNIHQTSKGYL